MWKTHFCLNLGKNSPIIRYLVLFWKFCHLMFPKTVQIENPKINIINLPWQMSCLAKFFFCSYGPKFCQPIRLQDSSKFNILRMTWVMNLIFLCSWASIAWNKTNVFIRHFEWMWWSTFGDAQRSLKWWVSNISRTSWGMKLVFWMWVDMHECNNFIQAFQLHVFKHAQAYPKHFKMMTWKYLKNHSRYGK